MFGLADLFGVIISAFIILPIVAFFREVGYLIVSAVFGMKNPRLTIGSGPRVFKFWVVDVRKYYHIYSWFSYDSIRNNSKFVYVCVYAAPIVTNLILALSINALSANGFLSTYHTFWERFIFYEVYYILLDAVPMLTLNAMPNNGMIIYEMIRYGKRVDPNKDPFLPATSEVEEQYQEELKRLRKGKKK